MSFLAFDRNSNLNHYTSLRFLTFDNKKQPKLLYFLEFPDFLMFWGHAMADGLTTAGCPEIIKQSGNSQKLNGMGCFK